MTPDVTLLAALLAGLVSFLSPCVLPLVPPYLVYLAGTSLERLADAEPEPGSRRDAVLAALPVRLRLLHRVRRAGRQRQRHRRADPRLFGRALDCRRHRDHRHGTALPRRVSHRRAASAKSGWRWRSRSGCGAPMRWGSPSHSAGRRASARSLRRSWRSRPPSRRWRKGAGLLAVYSLGLGIPFLLAAFAVEPFAAFLARFRRHLAKVERVMGGLAGADRHRLPHRLCLAGELLAAGGVSRRSAELAERGLRWRTASSGKFCGSSRPSLPAP